MTMEYLIPSIIFGVVWLISTEIIYYFQMKDQRDMDDWCSCKMASLLLSLFVMFLIIAIACVTYDIFKNYPFEFGIGMLFVIVFIGFFIMNYHIGKKIVNGGKKKKKKNG